MSAFLTAAPAAVRLRLAEPADFPMLDELIVAAYAQYARVLGPDPYARYLSDLLDRETHTRHGRLIVAEVDGRIAGSVAFYPDASVQGLGWPVGWAGGRALAVHPDARGRGVAESLMRVGEQLAGRRRARTFAFHTASFMPAAVAVYERMGYRRAPEFDLDLTARFGADIPILGIAYRRDLPNGWATRTPSPRRSLAGGPAGGAARGPDAPAA